MSVVLVWIHRVIQLAEKTLWFIRILSQSRIEVRGVIPRGNWTTNEVITSHALLLCKKSDVTAQRQVRPTNGSQQCNGAKEKPPNQPWPSAAPLRLRHFRCVKGKRNPEEKQQNKEAHHLSVVATQR